MPLHPRLARPSQGPVHTDNTLNILRKPSFGERGPRAGLPTSDVNRGVHPNRESAAYRAHHTQSNCRF